MGINAIKCEGLYADVKESEFGKGYNSSSDFDGNDLLKGAVLTALMAAGTVVSGCVKLPDNRPPPANVEYDKNATPVALGRIYDESLSGYGLDVKNSRTFEPGQVIGLRSLEKNLTVDNDVPFSNVCRVVNSFANGDNPINCNGQPIADGNIVAVYEIAEVYKVVGAQK